MANIFGFNTDFTTISWGYGPPKIKEKVCTSPLQVHTIFAATGNETKTPAFAERIESKNVKTIKASGDKSANVSKKEKQETPAGSSIDEELTKIFGDEYTKASEEEKQEFMVEHMLQKAQESNDNDKKSLEKIFEGYLNGCRSDEEVKRLAGTIKELKNIRGDSQTPTGPNINDRLTKMFGDKYTNASEEKKQEFIIRHISRRALRTGKPASEIVHEYLNGCRTDEEVDLLAGSIVMFKKAREQSESAKVILECPDTGKRRQGGKKIAHDYWRYHPEAQRPVLGGIIKSGEHDFIRIAAGQVHRLAKENQVAAVQKLTDANLSKELQVETDKILIDQYKDYAKENQIDIHKLMSGSKFSETVEYAASNIWHFDKSNQAGAVQITVNTGNKAAIQAAAAQWSNYDDSAKNEIKSIILSTNDNDIKETLQKAELAEQEEKANSSNKSTEEKADGANKTQPASAKIQEIIAIVNKKNNNNNNPNLLKEKIKRLSEVDKLKLLACCKDADIIRIIMNDNPSMEILSKIDASYIEETGYKTMLPYIGFLNPQAQLYIVKQCAANGRLEIINRDLLSPLVKSVYDKLLQEKTNKIA